MLEPRTLLKKISAFKKLLIPIYIHLLCKKPKMFGKLCTMEMQYPHDSDGHKSAT